jgi:NADH dehydrogenase
LGDKFLTTLIAIAHRSPVLALFGAGNTKLQPVCVSDVAEAVGRVVATCESSQCKIYELGGPRIYRYRDIVELVVKGTGRRRVLMPMPFFAWEGLARLLMLLPNPPLTTDVVTLMRHNNVVAEGASTFADLGLVPAAMETVLPAILNSQQ